MNFPRALILILQNNQMVGEVPEDWKKTNLLNIQKDEEEEQGSSRSQPDTNEPK